MLTCKLTALVLEKDYKNYDKKVIKNNLPVNHAAYSFFREGNIYKILDINNKKI